MLRFASLLAFVIATAPAGAAVAQDNVTIYRCTDARGKLTIQDAPCAKGQTQQAREMLRPKDPAPAAPAPITPATISQPAPPPQVVVVRTPQPLYECVRPDSSVYTSDSGEGNPRWVSVYDDYPYLGAPFGGYPGGGATIESRETRSSGIGVSGRASTTRGDTRVSARIGTGGPAPPTRVDRGRPTPPSSPSRPPRYPVYGYPSSTLVRDDCHALPQIEVCDRIRDRRDEIRRRFFNAQPSERATLDKEERGINARLSNDCGGR